MEDKTHFCTRSWRNADGNWAGEKKWKVKRKGRKGARDGDMKKKKNYPWPFSWPFPLVMLSCITQASTNLPFVGSRHIHEIVLSQK